ncbi:MAG: hypothetical protein IPI67_11285 [Myxococcales bacterium]|nr:hypothetical protein [Myxococcales bacterium]
MAPRNGLDFGRLVAAVGLAALPLAITVYCGSRRRAELSKAFDRFARRLTDKGLTLERAQRDNWHFTGSWLGYPVSAAIVKRKITSDYHTCSEVGLAAPSALGRAVVYSLRFDLPRRIQDELAELPGVRVDAELTKHYRTHAAPGVDLAARLGPDLRRALLGFENLVSLDTDGDLVTVALDGIECRPEHIEAALDLTAAFIEPRPVSAPARGRARISWWGIGAASVFVAFWPALLLSRLPQVTHHLPDSDPWLQFFAIFDPLHLVLITGVAVAARLGRRAD